MNKKVWLGLAIILVIAGFLRFYQLTSTPPGLYPDEAMDGNNALAALHSGDFKVFYPPNNGVEGLYANIEALVIATAGVQEPWTLRFPAAVFGFLTVLGLFFLARELFKKNSVALLSAFFLATSFWHINFSRIGFRAIMAPFFMVWALYFLLKAREAQKPGRLAWFGALGGLAFGLGFYSYISYRIMPLLLLLFVPFFFKQKRFWQAAGIFAALAIITVLPLGIYFLQHPADFLGRTSQVSIFSSPNPALELFWNKVKTIGMLNFDGDHNWRHNFSGRPQLFWPVGIVFWLGLALGLVAICRRNRRGGDQATRSYEKFAYLLCFAWLALAALPVVLSNEGIPHALRAILMIPPIMILVGAGAAEIYELLLRKFHRHRHGFRVGLVFILSVFVAEAFCVYFLAWGKNPNVAGAFNANYVEIGRQVRALPEEAPKYILVLAGGVTVPQTNPWDPAAGVQHIPVPAQTVMFLTDSYLPEQQKAKNIHYLVPGDEAAIPEGAKVFIIE